jgi:hypothetical protein
MIIACDPAADERAFAARTTTLQFSRAQDAAAAEQCRF